MTLEELARLERGTPVEWRARKKGMPGRRTGTFEGFQNGRVMIRWRTLSKDKMHGVLPEQVVRVLPL